MDFGNLIPISLFVCITVAIKIIAESRLRRRLAETHANEELIKAMLMADEKARQMSAFKWGTVLVSLGGAFGLIEAFHLRSDSPGTWGLLLAAAGAGMLGYHFIASKR